MLITGVEHNIVERAVGTLSPITGEMNRLMQDLSEIDRVLKDGADKARAIAAPILQRTYDIVGLLRPERS